jgi:hypothetical protein
MAGVKAFCLRELGTGGTPAGPHARLLAVCRAYLGDSLGPDRGLVAPTPMEDGFSPDAANDALLLLRAGLYCRCVREAPMLARAVATQLLRALERRSACRSDGCSDELRYRLDQHMQVASNLLLAYFENPSASLWADQPVREALRASAVRLAIDLRNFDEPSSDPVMRTLCEELEVPYRQCREVYHMAPLLLPKLTLITAQFLATASSTQRCDALIGRLRGFAEELSYRPGGTAKAEHFATSACNRNFHQER